MRSNKSGLLAGRLVSQGTFRPLFNKHRSAYNGVLTAYGPAHLAAPEGMDVVTERARGSVSPSHFWEPAPINAPGRISPINFLGNLEKSAMRVVSECARPASRGL